MQVSQGRIFMGRLPSGGDLLEEITAVCRKNNIRLGIFSVIGALRKVQLGYYDQKLQQYAGSVDLKGKFEITCCAGNISLKDGGIFVHAHITLGAEDGKAFGGHLMPGAEIFAAEYSIQEFLGEDLCRGFDKTTGLVLWPEE